jgi:hypothetical protein
LLNTHCASLKAVLRHLHGSLIVKFTVDVPPNAAPETTAGGVTGVMGKGQSGSTYAVDGACPPKVPAFARTGAAVIPPLVVAPSPMPAAANASRGDSFLGASGRTVPEIAVATGTMLVWIELGMLGGAPGRAMENWPGSTSTVAPPEVKATTPVRPMFATPLAPSISIPCSSVVRFPGGDFPFTHVTKYVPRAVTAAVPASI